MSTGQFHVRASADDIPRARLFVGVLDVMKRGARCGMSLSGLGLWLRVWWLCSRPSLHCCRI